MDTFKAFSNHGLDAEQIGALRRPVARRTRAIFLATNHHQRHAFILVAHRGGVDRRHIARRIMLGNAAFHARDHFIPDTRIGEGAAHHHLMVAAPRAIAVEIRLTHLVFQQIFTGRRRLPDIPRRGDVVGRDGIRELRQDTRALHIAHRLRIGGHAFEVRRVLHIGAARIPAIGVAARFNANGLPLRRALEDIAIAFLEHLTRHSGVNRVVHFLLRRPDILEVNRLAIAARADGFFRQILTDGAGQRIGHHQRRGSEVIGAHIGMHAALEVAIARKHRNADQLVVFNRIHNGIRQRAGIADAGGAAIAHGLEAKRIQMRRQPRLVQIFRHHLGTRRERGLHPRLRRQALFHGLLRNQTRRDQHIGVRCIGAGSDGRDHDIAMAEVIIGPFHWHAQIRLVTRNTHRPRSKVLQEGRRGIAECHAILRPLRPGH